MTLGDDPLADSAFGGSLHKSLENIINEWSNTFGAISTFVGHSKGGALAQVVHSNTEIYKNIFRITFKYDFNEL